MKTVKYILLASTMTMVACGGKTTDPATVDRSDLNSPQNLTTVTGNGKITLWWDAQNAESNFQGYYVFAKKKGTTSSSTLAKYPSNVDVTVSGIPRCADNSAFFQAFGIVATTKDCKGADTSPTPSPSSMASTNSSYYRLADASTSTSSDVLTGFVTCAENTKDATISLTAASASVTTPQSCTVSKIGSDSLTNGVTYEFFVVAVKGSDKSSISWTSRLVTDTPSVDLLGSSGQALSFAGGGTQDCTKNGSGVANPNATYYEISFAPTSTSATVSSAKPCSGNVGACKLTTGNSTAPSTSNPTIYIGRDSSSPCYQQRFFISTSSGDTTNVITLQPRGNQTHNAFDKTDGARIPGDSATSTYSSVGTAFAVYANQIFDFKLTVGSTYYYGKVYINSVSYATATDPTSTATVTTSLILQPAAKTADYLR